MKIRVGTTTYEVEVTETGSDVYRVTVDGLSYNVRIPPEEVEGEEAQEAREASGAEMEGEATSIRAPLPGKVTSLEVRAGDAVTKGQPLVVLESMKMNVPVKASRSGTVRKLCVSMGQNVNVGQEVAVLE